MALLDRIVAARRERSWPVGAGAVMATDRVWGHDQSEFSPVEYGDYLATSNDIYSVVSARARLVSAAKLKFYRGSGSEKAEKQDSNAARLYRKVNDHWTAERLERMDELAMGVWGQTAWAIERGQRGEPDEIWWLKPSQLRPVPHEISYLEGLLYQPLLGEPPIHFTPDEVVWFRYPNPLDEFSPLSPLAAARLAADTASAMSKANRNLFENGLMAGGFIVPDDDRISFTTDQAEDLERQFSARMKGVDKAHRWAVLRYQAKMQALNITPKDAEFVAGLGLTFRQVCRAYGMQPALQGDLEHATLSNAQVFERLEWSRTLVPDLHMRAAEVREQYLPRFRSDPDYCEYDFTGVPALQEAASEAWAREAQALDRGAITINEWRTKQGMPRVPWGDMPYMPVNKAPIGDDGQLKLPKPQGGAANDQQPPDDEVNPASQPAQVTGEKFLDHHAARQLLAAFKPMNGVRL